MTFISQNWTHTNRLTKNRSNIAALLSPVTTSGTERQTGRGKLENGKPSFHGIYFMILLFVRFVEDDTLRLLELSSITLRLPEIQDALHHYLFIPIHEPVLNIIFSHFSPFCLKASPTHVKV